MGFGEGETFKTKGDALAYAREQRQYGYRATVGKVKAGYKVYLY